jgi:hypothetical protein
VRAPPAVPDGVLVQSIAVDEEGEPAGYRIFADGRYQTLPRGGDWADGAPLDGERLAAVERAIAASGVDRLAERYEGIPGHGEPRLLWIQIARGGSVRTISVVGRRRVPELERLTVSLTDAFRS